MTQKIEEAKTTVLKQFRKLQDPPGPSLKLCQWQRMARKERLSSTGACMLHRDLWDTTFQELSPKVFPAFP